MYLRGGGGWGGAVRMKAYLTSQQLPHDDAEGPDVRCHRARAGADHLGRLQSVSK